MKLTAKFNRCVKKVRKTVRARKGSKKESAAIAICTKSVLQTRGRTMKQYRRGRLVTQRKHRGGGVTGEQVYMMSSIISALKSAGDKWEGIQIPPNYIKEVVPTLIKSLETMKDKKDDVYLAALGLKPKGTGISTDKAIEALKMLEEKGTIDPDWAFNFKPSQLAAKLTNAQALLGELPAAVGVRADAYVSPKDEPLVVPTRSSNVQGSFFGAPRSGRI